MNGKWIKLCAAVGLPLAALACALSLAWFSSASTGSPGRIEAARFSVAVSVDSSGSSSSFSGVLTPTVAGDDARFNEVAQCVPVSVTNDGAVAVRLTFSIAADAAIHYAVVEKTEVTDAAAELAALGVTESTWLAAAESGLAAIDGSVLAAGGARRFTVVYWLCYHCAGYGGDAKPPAAGVTANLTLMAGAVQAEGGVPERT